MTPADPRVDRGARGGRPEQPEVPIAAPTEDERAAADSVLARYPEFRRDQLLSVLHEVRATGHWFSEELTRYLAQRLAIPFADLYGIISFYGLFKTVPAGRVVLRVCKGLPCYLHGAAQVGEHLHRLLDAGPGEPTP